MAETSRGCETDDLLLIHAVFRHAFGKAPDLVASIDPRDDARVSFIADIILEQLTALHDHHSNEDVVLWETLRTRAPESREDVSRMEQAHAKIAELITDLQQKIADWRADTSKADILVDALRRFNEVVITHLDDEEATIKPVAAKYLQQSEWDQMHKGGAAKIPKDRLLFQLGFLMKCSPRQDLTDMFWHALPLPARLAYRLFGKRKFEEEWALIYGNEGQR